MFVLPASELFADQTQIKFTAYLFNIMYIVLAAELGFSINISKLVGDNSDKQGKVCNLIIISKLGRNIFGFLCLFAVLIATFFYFNKIHSDQLMYEFKNLYYLASIVFVFQLYANKSYAIVMGTVYLSNLKIVESLIFFIIFTALVLNAFVFQNWNLHIVLFLVSSFLRSVALILLENFVHRHLAIGSKKNIQQRQLVFDSLKVGFSSLASQIFINMALSMAYNFLNIREANGLNVFARLCQGSLILVRQLTDLRFFQVSRDTDFGSKVRSKKVRKNLLIGLLGLVCISFICLVVYFYFKSNDPFFDQTSIKIIITFWLLLLAMNICGLTLQQFMLFENFYHNFITFFSLVCLFVMAIAQSKFLFAYFAIFYLFIALVLVVTFYIQTSERKIS